MERIKTLVVDDEPLALELVKGYVEQTPYLELVGCCSNAQEAYDVIERGDIELAFMDVQMPGISGMTLMKTLGARAPKVIFTTAFGQYAIEGFKLSAVDYLLKPFNFDEFAVAAAKARHLIELEKNNHEPQNSAAETPAEVDTDTHFFVKSEYKLVRIDIEKIVHVEGLKDYIKIYLDGEPKPVQTLISLKAFEQRLPSRNFLRVHKSNIINVHYVRGVERNIIHMHGGAKIAMGDGYKQSFTEVISKLTL